MALGGISKIVDVLSDYDLQLGTGGSEMAQRAKTIAKSDALSPTPGFLGVIQRRVLLSTCVLYHACMFAYLQVGMHTHNNKIMNNEEIIQSKN